MAKPTLIKETEETIKTLQAENFNLKLKLYFHEKQRNGWSSIPSSALLPEVQRLMANESQRRESDSQTEAPCLDIDPSISESAGMSSLGLLSDVSEMLNNPHDYSISSHRHRHDRPGPPRPLTETNNASCQTDLNLEILDGIFADYTHLCNRDFRTITTQTDPEKTPPKSPKAEVYCQVEIPPKKKPTFNVASQIETLTAPRINKQVQVSMATTSTTDSNNHQNKSEPPRPSPPLNNNLNDFDAINFSGMEEEDRICAKYLPGSEKKKFISNCIKTATIKRCSVLIDEQIQKINTQLNQNTT